jgi:hypothetical protein
MVKCRGIKIRIAVFAALLLCGSAVVFSQDEITERGSIPEELLRPRREESPRYPIDTVIGTLGQGQTPNEAYALARKTAAALLAGTMDAPVLASVNRVFLEGCMSKLQELNPRSFRLGGGREEPDGSVSYLVRFVGREQGITGELFVRYEEKRVEAPEPAVPPSETELESGDDSAGQSETAVSVETAVPAETTVTEAAKVPAEKVWIFEDLILEEVRSREEENAESPHRFDFPPYERFF